MTEAFRREFSKLLGSDAEYLKIREGSKSPVGSFLPGRRNRLKEIPLEGNYGVIPNKRLVIIDIDDHGKGSTVESQIAAFSKILKVDLEETFTVDTPSEGRHFYVRLPRDVTSLNIPKTTLRSAQKAICEILGYDIIIDADIRSAAANAYVLGPTSNWQNKDYVPSDSRKILSIPREGFNNLLKLKEQSTTKDPSVSKNPASVDLWKSDPVEIPVDREHFDMPLPKRTIMAISGAISRKNYTTYHQKRAFVVAALHCCYSPNMLAEVCSSLEIDKDSSTGGRMSRYSLMGDVQGFKVRETFHGVYCPKKIYEEARSTSWSKAETGERLDRIKTSIEKKRSKPPIFPGYGEFRVVDMEKTYNYLMRQTNRKAPTEQIRNAMFIMENLVQPLSNSGAKKYLLAQSYISGNSHLSSSQVSAALRTLRQAGVLKIDELQKTGSTTVYKLPDHLYHKRLTSYLRKTWGNTTLESSDGSVHKPAVLWDPRREAFSYAHSGEAAHRNRALMFLAEKEAGLLALNEESDLKTKVAQSYLRYEQNWLDQNPEFKTVLHSPPRLILVDGGEKGEKTASESESSIKQFQLTGEEGLAPQKTSDYRPGLKNSFSELVFSPPGAASPEALGLDGDGNYGENLHPSQALSS